MSEYWEVGGMPEHLRSNEPGRVLKTYPKLPAQEMQPTQPLMRVNQSDGEEMGVGELLIGVAVVLVVITGVGVVGYGLYRFGEWLLSGTKP